MEGWVIRLATAADAGSVSALLAETSEAAHWSPADIADLLRSGANILICEELGELYGVVVWRIAGGEAEVLNLAVGQSFRRMGIGTELTRAVLTEAQSQGAESVFLEVRESNRVAREFYSRFGFIQHGRRRGYYNHPTEDALVLSRKLG